MPILNLHEFTFQMLLLPSWLTMMCTVQYWLLYYCRMKRIVMACFYEFRLFLFYSSHCCCQRAKTCCELLTFCCPCTDVGVKEELSDVDDTASGTDWLMLNSQQYLMHCLQHRKKRHTVQLLTRPAKCACLVCWPFVYKFCCVTQ